MKKVICISLLCGIITNAALAQAYEGKVLYRKVEQPALVMVYKHTAAIVENALVAQLADQQLKGSYSKGFFRYPNAVIATISKVPLDYSFRIEQNNAATTLYMVMEGASATAQDAAAYANNGKQFLEQLSGMVEKSNTIVEIKRQESVLIAEEQKLNRLKEDEAALQKRLTENQNEQQTQNKIIASQQSILNDLKAKL